MSFGDHLDDLRKRLLYALFVPIPIAVVCLFFGPEILDVLLEPVEAQLRAEGLPSRLLATSPLEPFGAYLKVSIVVAVLVSFPWIIFQLWLFVAPGLYKNERRFAYFLAPLSAALTVVGTLFLYFVLLPISLGFLIHFGSVLVQTEPKIAPVAPGVVFPEAPVLTGDPPDPSPNQMWVNSDLLELRIALPQDDGSVRVVGMPLTGGGAISQQFRISEYINLVFMLGLVFAIAFQLPIVLMLLGWSGLVEPGMLTRHRKYVLFGCAIASAFLTPADPVSMLLLMAPLYVLFEFGIVLMKFMPASRVSKGVLRGTDGKESDDPNESRWSGGDE